MIFLKKFDFYSKIWTKKSKKCFIFEFLQYTLPLVLNFIEAVDRDWFLRARPHSNIVMELSNCFAMLRSALNFPIFYSFGSRFRRLLKCALGLAPPVNDRKLSQTGVNSRTPSPKCSRYDLMVKQNDERTTTFGLQRSASANEKGEVYLSVPTLDVDRD